MIIIDKEMPTSCAKCFALHVRLLASNEYTCKLTETKLSERDFINICSSKNGKLKNCPLKEFDSTTLIMPKPCPFCGSSVVIEEKLHEYEKCLIYNFKFTCQECNYSRYFNFSPSSYSKENARIHAILDWNIRFQEGV